MDDISKRIEARLFELRDEGYRELQSKLMPGSPKEYIIGVRIPALKALAAELSKDPDIGEFLSVLPHRYYEEYNLHAFLIMREKSFDKALEQVEKLLPYVDNWATCDSIIPKAFARNTDALLPHIRRWIVSERTYTVRFAVGCLMRWYLDEHFKPEYPAMVAEVKSEEYYINMMCAWYFATALAKQYDAVIPYLSERRLPEWVHKKTIQKARESFRVTEEHKEYLKGLK